VSEKMQPPTPEDAAAQNLGRGQSDRATQRAPNHNETQRHLQPSFLGGAYGQARGASRQPNSTKQPKQSLRKKPRQQYAAATPKERALPSVILVPT